MAELKPQITRQDLLKISQIVRKSIEEIYEDYRKNPENAPPVYWPNVKVRDVRYCSSINGSDEIEVLISGVFGHEDIFYLELISRVFKKLRLRYPLQIKWVV